MKVPFPSLSKSFGLLLSLCLVAGCSNDASAGSGDGAASGGGKTVPASTHQLAIKDCAGAAALFGDKLQGLELVDNSTGHGAQLVLACDWRTPARAESGHDRFIGLIVHVEQRLTPEQTLQSSGYNRISAPAFERSGGKAYTVATGNTFFAELPDARVIIITEAGPDVPSAQLVTDAMRLDVARRVFGL